MSDQLKNSENLLIARAWKWLIIIFWVLVVAVVFAPSGDPKDIIWYSNVSLSILLVGACTLLVVLALIAVFINRHQLGIVKGVLASLLVIVCNVPGSMVLYVYLKNKRIIW